LHQIQEPKEDKYVKNVEENNQTKQNAVILTLVMAISFLFQSQHLPQTRGLVFQKKIEDEGAVMTLRGLGLKSVLLIRAFVAAFYLGNDVPVKMFSRMSPNISMYLIL